MGIGPLLIVIAAFLWAIDGVLRRSLYGLPAPTLIFFEHLLGCMLLLPFVWKKGKEIMFSRKDIGTLFSVSLFSGVIGTLLFTMALASVGYIPMSIAILIQKLQPIFAIGVAVFLGKEEISRTSFFFIIVALISGYFVTFPDGVNTSPDGQKELMAALYALGAAIAWGGSTNLSKSLLKKHNVEVITFLRFTVTAIIIAFGLVLIPAWGVDFRFPNMNEWKYLFIIACSTGLVALYIYYKGLKSVPVHVSAILELTWPIVAIIIDYFMYGTILSGSQYIATCVLILSMYRVTRVRKGSKISLPQD